MIYIYIYIQYQDIYRYMCIYVYIYIYIYIPVAVITLLLLVVRAKTWLFWNDQLFRGRGQLAPVFLKGLRLGLGAWDLEAQIALGVIENSEHRMVYAVG